MLSRICQSTNQWSKENLLILEGLHSGIERLDDTIKKTFGSNSSFDGVYNHKLLQETVLNIKRKYIKQRSGFGKKAEEFFIDSNNSKVSAVYLQDYKNYLKNWIGENILHDDIKVLKNSEKLEERIQYENATNYLADTLDVQLSADK